MIKAWLNEPIPRYKALIATGLPFLASTASAIFSVKQMNHDAEVIKDQNQKLTVLGEMTDFLLDNALDRTIAELDERVEFWRVVRPDFQRSDPEE
jgi:hypothetical protein